MLRNTNNRSILMKTTSARASEQYPAKPARLADQHSSALSTALRTMLLWRMRSSQRKALRELACRPHLLRDVGLDREQALQESAKPFWQR
jgi:uncharacterized protein YjiS (DUF1127 family)